jgi:hypothetical protein
MNLKLITNLMDIKTAQEYEALGLEAVAHSCAMTRMILDRRFKAAAAHYVAMSAASMDGWKPASLKGRAFKAMHLPIMAPFMIAAAVTEERREELSPLTTEDYTCAAEALSVASGLIFR